METLHTQVTQRSKGRRRRKLWYRIVAGLSSVAVFCTTYAMILPAITMVSDDVATCGMINHQHDKSCYSEQEKVTCLCGETQHRHSEACYDEAGSCVCGYADYAIHTHDSACYDTAGNLICTLPEVQEHTPVEGEDSGAYAQPVWSEAVTEAVLHQHTDECYVDGVLCCGCTEILRHQHSEDCMEKETVSVLTCGLPEHEHDMSCLAVQLESNPYVCGYRYEHQHSEYCYLDDRLICTMVEHTHTRSCLPCTCGAGDGIDHAADCPRHIEISTIRSAPAADGAVAVIRGDLPENAAASIEAVPLSAAELAAYFGSMADAMTGYVAYDIKIFVDGAEWQPNDTVSVTVQQSELTAAEDAFLPSPT